MQALRRALELAQRRYESGVSSYLEVLDAQRGLFTAQLALVQTERQYLGIDGPACTRPLAAAGKRESRR